MSYQTSDHDECTTGSPPNEHVDERPQPQIGHKLSILGVVLMLCGSLATFNSSLPTFQPFHDKFVNLASEESVKYSQLTEKEKIALFEQFKVDYDKTYKNDDVEKERFKIFKKFLSLVDDRNDAEARNGGTALHGITQFADLTQNEFVSTHLGYIDRTDGNSRALEAEAPEDIVIFWSSDNSTDDDSSNSSIVNWAGVYTTSINNQGDCGSCWAFSSIQQIESDAIRHGYSNTSEKFSYQQLVSCDSSGSCSGGNTDQAYEYVMDNGGLETADEYPYKSYYGADGTCDSSTSDLKVTVDKYYSISTEDDMETHVTNVGPLSVCLDASSWASYKSGIVSSCNTTVDHCVQVVGINKDEDYWIVRNSWGTTWGVDGYIYLELGVNICDITHDVTYTEPALV